MNILTVSYDGDGSNVHLHTEGARYSTLFEDIEKELAHLGLNEEEIEEECVNQGSRYCEIYDRLFLGFCAKNGVTHVVDPEFDAGEGAFAVSWDPMPLDEYMELIKR